MRRWVWYIAPAIIFRWYFFFMGKFFVNFSGQRVPCERLDEELLIIWYPTDGWYKKRGWTRPEKLDKYDGV